MREGRWGELRRERTEGCSLGIDLDRVAAIQGHPDEAADVDVLDDAAVARAETRIVFCIANELDPRTDGHTRTNAGRKEACADGIHGLLIGFDGRRLDPATRGPRRRTSSPGESACCRRAVPNSTA